jgi:hypothetical protein
MTLIYSDKGEILSAPESEDSERIQDDSITIRYFNDQNGWKFALAVKIARCIRFKPCLKSDEYLSSKSECKLEAEHLINSWLTKPQKKIYGRFMLLDFQQPELPFD